MYFVKLALALLNIVTVFPEKGYMNFLQVPKASEKNTQSQIS